jgi:hypothetical protein
MAVFGIIATIGYFRQKKRADASSSESHGPDSA